MDAQTIFYAFKVMVQGTLVAMLLYQSYYGLHDRMIRFYFEYRLIESFKWLFHYEGSWFHPFMESLPFIMARHDLPQVIHYHANLIIWVLSAQGSAWIAGFILLNSRLGCYLALATSPVFAVMYNLFEIIEFMNWEKTP